MAACANFCNTKKNRVFVTMIMHRTCKCIMYPNCFEADAMYGLGNGCHFCVSGCYIPCHPVTDVCSSLYMYSLLCILHNSWCRLFEYGKQPLPNFRMPLHHWKKKNEKVQLALLYVPGYCSRSRHAKLLLKNGKNSRCKMSNTAILYVITDTLTVLCTSYTSTQQ